MSREPMKKALALIAVVLMFHDARASHAVSALGSALPILILIGLVLVSHAVALLLNLFLKRRKLHIFNLVLCIVISALLLLIIGKIGFTQIGAFAWYFPIAWTLWKLGTPKTKQI
jgi:hypothetical protein